MSILELKFVISETMNCPIYKNDDYFELSGVSITPPENKSVCVFPAQVMAGIVNDFKGEDTASFKKRIMGKEFNCGGCVGVIKFVCTEKEKYKTEHMRMLAAFEAKQVMEKKADEFGPHLKAFSLFNCLSESIQNDILLCSTMEEFPADHTILKVDTPGKNLYLLLAGTVILLSRQGETIGFLGKGEVLGEMSLMFNRLINATVKTVEPAQVLVINAADFQQLLLKYPSLQIALARQLAKRLSKSNEQISNVDTPGIKGELNELPASELFQMIHENMKSGKVELVLQQGSARVDFIEGEIVDVKYHDMTGKEAFYAIIIERNGSFNFNNIPPEPTKEYQPIGGFMSMLMEGLRLLDEKKATTP